MEQKVQQHDPVKVAANGIEIVYDSFGKRSDPALLLVMGLGGQMIAWDKDFCEQLAAQGYWVIRFDNRDVGLSTWLDAAGVPDLTGIMQARMMQAELPVAPYTLRDMADDAVGLLNTIGVEKAHLVGVSMGGMIVQEMAIHHPERIRTMTSIMSSTSNPALPPPRPEAMAILMKAPETGRAAYIESAVESSQVLQGSELPFDEARVRERAGRAFDRGLNSAGTSRQLAAILTSGGRKEALKAINVPALVIHGSVDPLVPLEGGIDTADAIPGAELLIIDGMGHGLPPTIWSQVMDAIVKHAT